MIRKAANSKRRAASQPVITALMVSRGFARSPAQKEIQIAHNTCPQYQPRERPCAYSSKRSPTKDSSAPVGRRLSSSQVASKGGCERLMRRRLPAAVDPEQASLGSPVLPEPRVVRL